MATIEFHVKPQGPVLEDYYLSNAPIQLIRGPLGSGKTIMSCFKLFKYMREEHVIENDSGEKVRRSRYCAVRNTYSDLFSTTIKDWLGLFSDLGRFRDSSKEPPTHFIKFLQEDGTMVESELVFIAFDRPEHVKKARGTQFTGIWLNEVKELDKAVVDMLDLRHGRFPLEYEPKWHGMIGDYNSPDSDHWLHTLAEEEKPKDWAFFVQPGGVQKVGVHANGRPKFAVNPDAENLRNLPEGYYERGMQGKGDDWILVNLANEYGFVQEGRPVYSEYVDSMHCRPVDILPGLPIRRCWDYGFTPACLFYQIAPSGQLRFFYELCATRSGIERFTDQVLIHSATEYPGYTFLDVGDPAGQQGSKSSFDGGAYADERSCFDIQQAKGVDVMPGIQNEHTRIESVRYGLNTLIDGQPALVLDPACKMLRKGFQGGYAYRRIQVTGTARYADKPEKNKYSHPHDAAQYAAADIFGDIITGDTQSTGGQPARGRRARQVSVPELPQVAVDEYDIYGG